MYLEEVQEITNDLKTGLFLMDRIKLVCVGFHTKEGVTGQVRDTFRSPEGPKDIRVDKPERNQATPARDTISDGKGIATLRPFI